jgi:8-oxo-dGTP diphosphatase
MIIEVTAAVIEREGKILLLRRAPGQKLEGRWEFPGGKVEHGESDEACLERELREELGIIGRAGAHVCDSAYSYAFGDILLKAYSFSWTGGDMQLRVHDKAQWLRPCDLICENLSPADIPIAQVLAKRAIPFIAGNRTRASGFLSGWS